MDLKTIGLGLHFLLELAALAGMVTWGFHPVHSTWQKILFGIGLPILAAAVWGIFRVPNDPGQALIAIPGALRLALELVFFCGAAFALYAAGHTTAAVVFAAATLLNYGMMHDRVRWLLNLG